MGGKQSNSVEKITIPEFAIRKLRISKQLENIGFNYHLALARRK